LGQAMFYFSCVKKDRLMLDQAEHLDRISNLCPGKAPGLVYSVKAGFQ
jgi:hypothetical protein